MPENIDANCSCSFRFAGMVISTVARDFWLTPLAVPPLERAVSEAKTVGVFKTVARKFSVIKSGFTSKAIVR